MRAFPLVAIAFFFCSLAQASAQQLECNPCNHAFGKEQVGNPVPTPFNSSTLGKQRCGSLPSRNRGAISPSANFLCQCRSDPGQAFSCPLFSNRLPRGGPRGVITLVSTALDSPLTMDVAGTGVVVASPQLGISPATLSLGNVTVGSSASLQATLTASNAAVTISSDRSTSSEFAILGLNLPVTIPAGQSVQSPFNSRPTPPARHPPKRDSSAMQRTRPPWNS